MSAEAPIVFFCERERRCSESEKRPSFYQVVIALKGITLVDRVIVDRIASRRALLLFARERGRRVDEVGWRFISKSQIIFLTTKGSDPPMTPKSWKLTVPNGYTSTVIWYGLKKSSSRGQSQKLLLVFEGPFDRRIPS